MDTENKWIELLSLQYWEEQDETKAALLKETIDEMLTKYEEDIVSALSEPFENSLHDSTGCDMFDE